MTSKLTLPTILWSLAAGFLAGCQTPIGQLESRPVSTRLSVDQVKQLAAARAQANGFTMPHDTPWATSLAVEKTGYVWAAHAVGPRLQPFWIQIDDASSKAEFVMPTIHVEQKFPPGADWLIKVDKALREAKYPIPLEELMRTAHFADAIPMGGGGTRDGRAYLEYSLRWEDRSSPVRFDVRCYHLIPKGVEPIVVTSAEIAYIDANVYRYRLVRDMD